MSLLTIVQDAADEIGIPSPGTVIGNNDQTVVQMLALLNREGRNLAKIRNKFGGGWAALELEHTFPTVASQDLYALPLDFERLISDSVWNRNTFFEVRGPLSPQQWQAVKSGLAATPAIRHRYRIKRASSTISTPGFFLDPTPSDVETVVFEYLTKNWVTDGITFSEKYADDDDSTVLDENLLTMGLIWRWRKAKGLAFAGDLGEYELERDRMIAADGGSSKLFIARRHFTLPPLNVPETGFG